MNTSKSFPYLVAICVRNAEGTTQSGACLPACLAGLGNCNNNTVAGAGTGLAGEGGGLTECASYFNAAELISPNQARAGERKKEKRRILESREKRRDPQVIQVEPHKLLTKFSWATASELC